MKVLHAHKSKIPTRASSVTMKFRLGHQKKERTKKRSGIPPPKRKSSRTHSDLDPEISPEEVNLDVVECILKVSRNGKNLVRIATPKPKFEQRNPGISHSRRFPKSTSPMIVQRRSPTIKLGKHPGTDKFSDRRLEMRTLRHSNRRRSHQVQVE